MRAFDEASLRTISGLPKHTRLENLQAAVALPPLENIIQEQVNQSLHKRSLTHQGVSLIAWDNLQQRQPHDIPPPLAPWRRPSVSDSTTTHPVPRNARPVRAARINALRNSKHPHEVDIYTDASIASPLVGIAWASPDITSIQGKRSLHMPQVTILEAELHAIIHTIDFLMFDFQSSLPSQIRILTDCFEALKILQNHASTNPIANKILHQISILQSSGIHVRIDWSPGHEESSPGNEAAHTAARECIPATTPLFPDLTAPPPHSIPPAMQLLRYKKEKKKDRLKAITPTGFLSALPPLPRSAEIFLNKYFANASHTPETFRQWYTPSLPPRCPYCTFPTPADLQHLIWHCPKFTRYRTFTPPPNASFSHVDPHTLDPSTLCLIATYSIKSGLARAV